MTRINKYTSRSVIDQMGIKTWEKEKEKLYKLKTSKDGKSEIETDTEIIGFYEHYRRIKPSDGQGKMEKITGMFTVFYNEDKDVDALYMGDINIDLIIKQLQQIEKRGLE